MPGPPALSAPDAGPPKPPRIAVLIAGGPLAHMLVNGLQAHFGSISVLREEPEPKLAIVRRRARLIGWPEALGQAAFGLVQKLITRRSAARLAAIWEEHGLDPRPDPEAGRARGRLGELAGVPHGAARARPRRGRRLRHAHHQARDAAMRGGALHQLPRRRQPQVPRARTAPTGRAARAIRRTPASPCTWSTRASTPATCSTRQRPSSRPPTTSPPISTGRWRPRSRS